MASETDGPEPAENHWMTTDPEGQPPRDMVAGLGRMVIETRDRLGPTATPEVIAAELKERGVDTTAEAVRQALAKPY